jgi:hypothetical protein
MRQKLWVLAALLSILMSQFLVALVVVDWRDTEPSGLNATEVQELIDQARFGPPPTEDWGPPPDLSSD